VRFSAALSTAESTICLSLPKTLRAPSIVLRATNAGAESINSRIQKVKRMANGFRNRERFRNAIYFHLSHLQLHP